MDLESVADELYGLAPEDFGPRRTQLAAQARAAGERGLAGEIAKLKKPVRAAALVNELVRARPAEIKELRELARQLRDAHRHLRGPQLRGLSEQRQRMLNRLAGLARDAADAAGRPAGEQVLEQLRATLEAAIADEAAEVAALSGRLTSVLFYTGFGEVDVSDAIALPVRPRHLHSVPDDEPARGSRAPEHSDAAPVAAVTERAAKPKKTKPTKPVVPPSRAAAQRARSERALERAAREQAITDRAVVEAAAAVESAQRRLVELTERVQQLQSELDRASAQTERAARAHNSAERRRMTAARTAERAARTTGGARIKLQDGPEATED